MGEGGGGEGGSGVGAGWGGFGGCLVWTIRSSSGRIVELVPGGASRPLLFHEREVCVCVCERVDVCA